VGCIPISGSIIITDLLKSIKERFEINVHGFSPPEVCYLARKHNITIRETIQILRQAGLDSIPGGGQRYYQTAFVKC